MILTLKAIDDEARRSATYATKVAESNERDMVNWEYRVAQQTRILVTEQLDLFRLGLNNRGREIKVLDGLMKNLQNHVARELTKVPAVVATTENIQVNTDFAAQFAQQLNHNDQELANVAGNMRQIMHRLYLVEGQQNALALGVSTTSGKVLQTNVTAAGQDIRQLRLDYNNLEKQFIEMRSAIGEALLTKTPAVKASEDAAHQTNMLRQELHTTTRVRELHETLINSMQIQLNELKDTKSDKRRKKPQ